MAAISDYIEQSFLNYVLRDAALVTLNANNYVALYTAAPNDAGGGTECAGSGYARIAVSRGTGSWDAPSGGATQNTSTINFGTAGGAWGTIVAVGILDASSGGNLLLHGAVTPNKTINNGDPVSYAAGALDITLTNPDGTGMSAYLRDALINWLLRGVAFPTLPASVHFSLHTGAPGQTGASEVPSSGAYARVSVTRNTSNFSAATTGGTADNVNQITWPAPTGNWGTITDAGMWDAASAGNFLWTFSHADRTVNNGDQAPYIGAGEADFTVA